MKSQEHKRAIGTFANRQQTEEALYELRNLGFPMNRVSVLAKNTEDIEQIAGAEVKDSQEHQTEEGAGIGATTGTVLGGIGGLLVGLEALIIPGAGPFFAAGTIATTLAGAGFGAAAGGLVGALTALGIPEDEAKNYSEKLSQGEYLIIVEGSEEEIQLAASILTNHGIQEWRIHNIPNGLYNSDVARTASVS
jgi:hypothetical protein